MQNTKFVFCNTTLCIGGVYVVITIATLALIMVLFAAVLLIAQRFDRNAVKNSDMVSVPAQLYSRDISSFMSAL